MTLSLVSSETCIALVGLPGSGKSTLGRQLAKRLQLPFVDTDHLIEQRLGCSIREFFEREGEVTFRDLEQSILDELTTSHRGIISTGGGCVLRPQTRHNLHEKCIVVYLRASPEEIYRRLKHDTKRPLLQVNDVLKRLRELFEQRDPLYAEASHFVVDIACPSSASLLNMTIMQLELAGVIPK